MLPNTDLGDNPKGTPPDAAQQAQIREALGIAGAPIPVLNAAERLALGTPAGTYVEQNDVPNVIFFQTYADASDAASWIALPASKEADGSFLMDLRLPNAYGINPEMGALAHADFQPVFGDGFTLQGRRMAFTERPQEGIITVNWRYHAFSATVSDTDAEKGFCYSLDGATVMHVQDTNPSGTQVSGLVDYLPKQLRLWSARGSGGVPNTGEPVGKISHLSVLGAYNLEGDVSGLTDLILSNFLGSYVPLSEMPLLAKLAVSDFNVIGFDFRANSNLQYVDLSPNFAEASSLAGYVIASDLTIPSFWIQGTIGVLDLRNATFGVAGSSTHKDGLCLVRPNSSASAPSGSLPWPNTVLASGLSVVDCYMGLCLQSMNVTAEQLAAMFTEMAPGAATIHVYQTTALADPDWASVAAIATGKGYTINENAFNPV